MTNSEIKIKALKSIGGTEWEKAGHHRIYFNRAAEKFAGIVIDRYNTNFYSAKNFEIYYDIDTDEFASRADGVEETAIIAIASIKKAAGFDDHKAAETTSNDDDQEYVVTAEIKRLIELNEIINSDASKIEDIADRFPGEYSNEQEYVSFQQRIGSFIDEIKV